MIHAQQRRETAAATPAEPDPAASETVVPAQQKRRPDAYDLYAEIFAIRAESHPA
ncbi:hypothetical protein G7072_04605 [Nocardioides sp. HDW12B]|uniref:hypothetical protein n=1 Tax=Nocardioides sp. HDW12B TaxID=2714939 RepID=UPI00140DD911|nr:hypothetical protein [Nocardioides sp. HDW12B]QIK65718.1 hypothetical protein G7072_04605 [Nocardioides sp. HDW12B]